MSWLFVTLDIRDQDVRIWILASEQHVVRAHMGPAIIPPLPEPRLLLLPQSRLGVQQVPGPLQTPPHTLKQCIPPVYF